MPHGWTVAAAPGNAIGVVHRRNQPGGLHVASRCTCRRRGDARRNGRKRPSRAGCGRRRSRPSPCVGRRRRRRCLPAFGHQDVPGDTARRDRCRRRLRRDQRGAGPRLCLAWRRTDACRPGHGLAGAAGACTLRPRLRRPRTVAWPDRAGNAAPRIRTEPGTQQLFGQAYRHADGGNPQGRTCRELSGPRPSRAAARARRGPPLHRRCG